MIFQKRKKGCGGTKMTRSGTIESFNFPTQYPDNATCEWLIQVTNGYTLNVYFNSNFNIDGAGDWCNETVSNDYLELRNGEEDDAPPLVPTTFLRNSDDHEAFYCGSSAPAGEFMKKARI